MRLCPSTGLTRLCRALGALWVLSALGLAASSVHAQRADAGAGVAPPDAAAPALDSAETVPSAAPAASSAPARGAQRSAEGAPTDNQLDQSALSPLAVGPASAGPPPSEGSTNLKYLLERIEVVGNKRTKVRMVKDFVSLEVGSSFNVSDPKSRPCAIAS